MHRHKLSLVFTLAIAAAQAKCYKPKTGTYGNTDDVAEAAINDFCNQGLAGYFTEGQTKYRCSWLQPNVKADIWVAWMGPGDLTLSSEHCTMRLKNEIYGCSVGGESVVADWYFRQVL
jgi:hypothetical protein